MDEIAIAKQYLQQQSEKTGINVYDHLTDIIDTLLDKRPKNAADIIEAVSSQIKRSKFDLGTYNAPLGFKKHIDDSMFITEVDKLSNLLQSNLRKGADDQEESLGQIPDILDLQRYFQWAGNEIHSGTDIIVMHALPPSIQCAVGSEETFHLVLSIRQLVRDRGLKSARFWGKIQGLKADYLIVEAEGATPAGDGELGHEQEKSTIPSTIIDSPELQGFPAPKVPPKIPLPKEEESGCNKYVYFVCSAAGQNWLTLPDVTPEQIVAARSIRKYFSGNLTTPVVSFPAFPGNEANLLRAQIARITASTVVCPAGYYMFDPEAADEDNPESNSHIIVNTEVEMFPNETMLSLENWVHQMSYILPQGRAVFIAPTPAPKEADENADEENQEDDDSGDATGGESEREVEPEMGPPLLTAITEDAEFGEHPAWSVRSCSRLQAPRYSPVHLRSNRWPGAHAIYYNGKFASIYFGDGLKDMGGAPFTLPKLPPIQSEFKPDVIEQMDPSWKKRRILKIC